MPLPVVFVAVAIRQAHLKWCRAMPKATADDVSAFILLIFLALVMVIGASTSPNCDEVGHLGSGVWMWRHQDFAQYRVNPPLVRAISAVPSLLMHAKSEPRWYGDGASSRFEWEIGLDFIKDNPTTWEWYFVAARWALLPIVLLGAITVYRWSTELWGNSGGLISTVLYCSCPNVIGWSSTCNPDAAAAAFGACVGYSFWKWLRHPIWKSALIGGVWLGLANLTKFSWIILFGLWPVLFLVRRCSRLAVDPPHKHTQPPSLGQFAAMITVALLIVNMGYLFQGSFTPLREFTFVSKTLAGRDSLVDGSRGGNRLRGTWAGLIPVPIPYDYLRGIDLQKVDFEVGKRSYLNGTWSERGWWYYYAYAAALKVPLGTLLLVILVIVLRVVSWANPRCERDGDPGDARFAELVLIAPSLLLFVIVSSQTGFSRYFRYVLPCFPFAYVWLGQLARWFCVPAYSSQAKVAKGVIGCLLAWAVVSSLAVYPHSMSYFNELAGGPHNGHRYLLDASIDWGQDAYYLRRWVKEHPTAKPLYMATQCVITPSLIGIDAQPPASDPLPGWYAMSIHQVYAQPEFSYFLRLNPVALMGYSIYVYHVTIEQANAVRVERGIPTIGNHDL